MQLETAQNVVIIGAGQAGSQTAQSLRKRGYDGEITIIGNEGHLPYQRPPLSKAYLKDQMAEARLYFKPDTYYQDQRVRLLLSANAASIDTAQQVVNCSDGTVIAYDRLVIASGSRPIPLPCNGASLKGVLTLRGIDDSRAIRESLGDSSRLVVIGGGYIGLEVASAARQLGHDVTVVERMPRLLSRVTSPPISEFYLRLHRDKEIDIRLDENVVEIVGDSSTAGVRLESDEVLAATTVLVGIGVRPAQAVAEAAGIRCEDGILVNADCQTSNDRIYAAGDCARRKLPDDSSLRLESVHNALVQAERIAAHIVGDDPPAYDPPWFWSDQFDIKLQTVGLFNDYTDILIRGDQNSKRFSALYFRDDEFIAVDAINDPVSFMATKQILRKGIRVGRDEASAPNITLKDVLLAKLKKEAS